MILLNIKGGIHTMRNALRLRTHLTAIMLFCVVNGCQLNQSIPPRNSAPIESLSGNEEILISQIETKQWNEPLTPAYDTLATHSQSEQLRRTAEQAQLAILKRITGEYKGIFDAEILRKMPRPLYVLADTSFTLPAGPPKFIRAKSRSDLQRLAAESKTDIYNVSMETVGTAMIAGRRGVVIHYSFGAIDWERAQWNALKNEERDRRIKPSFRGWEFGGGCYFCVVRDGSKLVFYEGPMIVS
jgi:hypothetical protein